MATAPTPFFPTTVVPPPPCGCGAPPYAPCSFPPTAAYPSPSFPGGYYTSPFPFYNNPPAFPYAATYPHPASMYTPTFPSPAGSSPNWPPPAPDPTPSTAPFPSPSKDDCTYFPLAVAAEDPSSKLVDAKLPPGHMLSPSEMPNPSLFVDRTCDSTPAGRVLPELHATKPPARRKTSVLKARTSRESRASSHRTTWASSSTACPPTQSSKAVTGGTPINSKTEEDDDATPLYGRDFQTEKINIAVHPAFPNFRCQGSDLTKGNNTSGASISGVHKHTGPKILSMELAEAQFSSAATNASSFYDTGTTASLSESSLSSPSDALATAYVAPKMFDEMPTPQSGYENCCSGHQNPIQSSYVHGGKTNLREKYIDDVPESYGFNNLSSHSVFLADGTERSYYVLPENFDLERAVPKPVFDVYDDDSDGCSNDYVHVFASPPKQQPHEEEQQESGQLPNSNCFSKLTLSDETPTVDTVGEISLTNEQSIYDLEKLNDGENLLFAKQGIAPSKCSGHHNPTQSSCLSTISEKNLDAQPQPYGLHNLLRQSVSLADGTKHDYFALPEDYPLQQASPSISPSAEEKYGVTAPLSVAAKAAGLSPFICSEANNTAGSQPMLVQNLQLTVTAQDTPKVCKEIPVYDIYEEEEVSACLNIFSDMRDFSLELQQQDDQRACKYPVLKAYDSDVTVSTKLCFEPRELRLLWDPGATKLRIMFITDAGATELQCVDVYKSAMVQILDVQIGARTLIFESAMMCFYAFGLGWTEVNIHQLRDPWLKVLVTHESEKEWDPGDHSILSSILNKDVPGGIFALPYVPTARIQFGVPTCVPTHSCYCKVPSSHENHEIQFLWDPGIFNQMDMILEESAVPKLVYTGQTTFRLSIFVGQPVDMKQLSALLLSALLQSHSWYNTLAVFLQVYYCGLAIVLDSPLSETVLQFACYSCMFSLTEAILSAICMSTATSVCAIVVLCSGKISQEGTDAAVLYKVLKIQLPTSNTSHIWDPGIESLLFPCNWLMNITELIQIKGWTSMTYNGIFLSEYPYILIFLHEQWEFLHQQGVQKNYNAKNLLAPQKYPQICEMDIIFITFLPP